MIYYTSMARNKKRIQPFIHDIIMILFGAGVAFILSSLGLIDFVVHAFQDYYILSSFIAGIFFTSVFTLAPASVALVHIAQSAPIGGVVVWGGIGAMCGDLILFFFVRDRFTEDLKKIFPRSKMRHILQSFHLGFLKWIAPIVGALIIASPLPDEFGITLLGMSKIKLSLLIPVSIVMNMLGIYALIGFSHLL